MKPTILDSVSTILEGLLKSQCVQKDAEENRTDHLAGLRNLKRIVENELAKMLGTEQPSAEAKDPFESVPILQRALFIACYDEMSAFEEETSNSAVRSEIERYLEKAAEELQDEG
jgi:hypothetical protein